MYLKRNIAKTFKEKYGNEYLFADALCFGVERVEVKAIHRGKTPDPAEWRPTMFVFKTVKDNAGDFIIDWDNPAILPYNDSKDW